MSETENSNPKNPLPGGGKPDAPPPEGWERDLLNRLAFASLNERRRARRWSILFKGLVLVWMFALLFTYGPGKWRTETIGTGRHTALVDMDGVIADDSDASADRIIRGLRAAFRASGTKGVILRINSPGGSPVQAGYINDEIHRLRTQYPHIPIYAVVTDMCASGGYYVAVAADKIYADKASIVGSIGVRMDSFGFVDAIRKLGIERRLLTSGAHKGMLDPFLPENPTEVAHVQQILDTIHQQFIDTVKRDRGSRLQADNPQLFSGLIWTGQQAVKLGLVDGLGSTGYVARDVIGAERIVDYTPRQDFLERFGERVGVAMGHFVFQSLLGGVAPIH